MSEPLNPEVAILNAALELSPGQRAAYLDQACAGDAALRRQVEALLQADDKAQGFLEVLPPALAFTQSDLRQLPLTEKLGDKVGRYKLLQKIGEGGCGVVYMAEQEEPVRRRVALKVIKLGMDTKEFVARFDAERQALALMDHPNIAKVFDAGASDTGRPYFVMELVRGTKITEFCDENKLSTEERLKLFILVCQAIQHAHQKGVIHRDIKPSNILVTVNDGVPVPKVIDFGIAKATAGRLTDQTLFTAFEQFIGTPAYMSPEQAVMTSQDIDTRSDIYSLGVLLYQLLTGRTPFDGQELLKAGLDEMRRVIREVEPVKPSTRLTQERLAIGGSASSGKSAIRNPQSAIDKDLDWIVMKCLEKDRVHRYETANGLAADLQRHLSSEPVAAGPPSNLYRLQKLIRRNKLVFTASAAVVVVLVLGAVASTWQAIRATRAEREQSKLREVAQTAQGNETRARHQAETDAATAKAEAAKSRQIVRFLEDMLDGVGPSVAMGRDTKLLQEILDKTAARVGRDFTNQPAVEAELRTFLGRVYFDIADYARGETMSRAALGLQQNLLGAEHQEIASLLQDIATCLSKHDKHQEAERLLRDAVAMDERIANQNKADVAGRLHALAVVLQEQEKLEEAEAFERRALPIYIEAWGKEHTWVAFSLDHLAMVLQCQGKLSEAEKLRGEALAMIKKVSGDEHPDVAIILGNLALIYQNQRKLAEAEQAYRDTLAMHRKFLPAEHPEIALNMNNLAGVLERQGKLDEAEDYYRQALAMERQVSGDESLRVATSLNNLAIHLRIANKLTEAEELARKALTIRRNLLPPDDPQIANSLTQLAIILEHRGELGQAELAGKEAVAAQERVRGPRYRGLANSQQILAQVLEKQRKLPEAEIMFRAALSNRMQVPDVEPLEVATAYSELVSLLLKAEKPADAETVARDWVKYGTEKTPENWRTYFARSALGTALARQKKYGDAEPLMIAACDGMTFRLGGLSARGKACLRSAMRRLIELYEETNRSNQAAEWKRKLAELPDGAR